jgi:hypothetical protein
MQSVEEENKFDTSSSSVELDNPSPDDSKAQEHSWHEKPQTSAKIRPAEGHHQETGDIDTRSPRQDSHPPDGKPVQEEKRGNLVISFLMSESVKSSIHTMTYQ